MSDSNQPDAGVTRRRIVQLTGGASLIGLAGCAGGDGGAETTTGGGGQEQTTTSGGGEETETTQTTEGNPKEGGKLTVLQPNAPPDFDPVKGLGISSGIIASRKVFPTLYEYEDGTKWAPADLVTGPPEIERENKRWTVELVDNAQWQNGDPITAEDVAFAFNEPLRQGTWVASSWSMAKNIEAIDDRTVQFDLKFGYGPFKHSLASMSIFPKSVYQQDPQAFGLETIVGGGPWQIAEWKQGEFTRLESWDDWWGEKTPMPNLDAVEFVPVKENTTRLTQFKTTDAGLMKSIPAKLYETASNIEGAQVEDTPALNYGFVSFNLKEGPTTDLKVRQAITRCVDLAEVEKRFWQPIATRTYQPLPRSIAKDLGMPVEKWKNMAVGKDVDEAARLFEEAGVPKDYTFRVIFEPLGIIEDMVVSIANGIKEAGWDAEVVNLDRGTFLERFTSGKEEDYNFYSLDWGLGVNPDGLIYNMFYEENAGANNGHYWSDDQVMDWILEARRASEERRIELWTKIQTEVIQQRVQIPAYTKKAVWGRKDFVKDWQVTPSTSRNPIITTQFGNNVWVDK